MQKLKMAVATATTTVAVGIAGLGTTAPARSAEDPSCPTAFPITDVVRDLAVTGLTVTSGTTPDQFTGKVLGVLQDGIAPGVPMIMVQATSANVTDHGIWQGMSGSPVYAPDGRLIGAVSYGLSASPSPIAGVTPAADMQKLLSATPAASPAAGTTGMARRVAIPQATASTLVASGDVTTTQAAGGFSRLKTPFVISAGGTRLDQLAAALRRNKVVGRDVTTMAGGGNGGTDAPDLKVVAGGNLAASVSYGDVTSAGIGTATEVCGSEVIGFGHPMNFSGTSTMTMHGADAITIQDDATFGGFKLANLGRPEGIIDQDHLAGIHGVQDAAAVPAVSTITSAVTVGPDSRTGQTLVSVPAAVPDIGLGHVVTDQDRVLDSVGKGSGSLTYKVTFTRENGTQQTVWRNDVYADQSDISTSDVWDLATLLYTLGFNGVEDVKIDSVSTRSNLTHAYQAYKVAKVELWRYGAWRRLHADGMLFLQPGTRAKFRVTLSSKQLGTRVVRESVPVPPKAGNKGGILQVFGGNTGSALGEDGDIFLQGMQAAGSSTEPTLDDQLAALRRTPHNDALVVDMTWFNSRDKQTNHKAAHVRTGTVVDGAFAMTIHGIPPLR
ncbi:MAG: hypothetical protein ACXVW6_10920 [Nocardioidaceae bacterium]